VELFFPVCVLNRTSVYLHSFVYVIDHLRTAIFILALLITSAQNSQGTNQNRHTNIRPIAISYRRYSHYNVKW